MQKIRGAKLFGGELLKLCNIVRHEVRFIIRGERQGIGMSACVGRLCCYFPWRKICFVKEVVAGGLSFCDHKNLRKDIPGNFLLPMIINVKRSKFPLEHI